MIYVIRHGQTDLNKDGKLQGRQGLPLNGNGIGQAEILKEKLKDINFDLIFSSPQERAVQTAKIAVGGEVIIDGRLDVLDLGEADGMMKSEVKMHGAMPDPKVYDGVEDGMDFVYRIFDFMKELEGRYKNKNLNILLSGHKCTTGCIGSYFEGFPEDGNIMRFASGNGNYKIYEFK